MKVRTDRVAPDAQTLGILLAGYLRQEKEEGRFGWDASAVLCVWPLSSLGIDEPGRVR